MTVFHFDDGGRAAAGFKGDARGDCVTRAIAIATERPYLEVYNALNDEARGMRQTKQVRTSSSRTGVSRAIYDRFLRKLGFRFVPTMGIGTGCKVHLKEDELPKGRIICRLSKHMVAVVDGVVRDLYDPTRDGTRCVYGYYVKD